MDDKIGPFYFSRKQLSYIRDGLYDAMWDIINTESDTKEIEELAGVIVDIIEATYFTDYPKEPIGGKNPYYCCSYCKKSDPEINGQIKNHAEWCEYRIKTLNLLNK